MISFRDQCSAILLVALFLPLSLAFAEGEEGAPAVEPAAEGASSEAASDAISAKKQEKPEKLSIDSSKTVQGVFYGFVSYIHPNGLSIVVIPQRPEYHRRTFMLDKKTLYKIDGKTSGRTELAEGDKVAVRYLGEPPLYLADAVFVVHGKYEPTKYIKKPKAKKPAGGAKPEKKGGH